MYTYDLYICACTYICIYIDEASEGGLLKERMIEPLTGLETDFKQYEKLVEQSLDLEGIDNHEYRINPRYNADLQVGWRVGCCE